MLNINNIGLLQYKTVTVATLIPSLNFFAQQVSPPNARSGPQGLILCLSMAKLLAVDNVCRHKKVQCGLWFTESKLSIIVH
jgi:hypothetical protein